MIRKRGAFLQWQFIKNIRLWLSLLFSSSPPSEEKQNPKQRRIRNSEKYIPSNGRSARLCPPPPSAPGIYSYLRQSISRRNEWQDRDKDCAEEEEEMETLYILQKRVLAGRDYGAIVIN